MGKFTAAVPIQQPLGVWMIKNDCDQVHMLEFIVSCDSDKSPMQITYQVHEMGVEHNRK